MNEIIKNTIITAIILGLVGLIAAGLLNITAITTQPLQEYNTRQKMLETFNELIDKSLYTNSPVEDYKVIDASKLLGTKKPSKVYFAKDNNNKVIGTIFESNAPDGYNGLIKMLVAINYDGKLFAVRVIKHQETPGLGDLIEIRKSDWIDVFKGKSLDTKTKWAVKKDGGEFDQFTGATITPRAVVKAIKHTLEYYKINKERLLSE